MPRDLFASASPPQGVFASPESRTPRAADEDQNRDEDQNAFTIHRDERQMGLQMLRDSRARADDRNELHPFVQTLSLSNLESCLALEEAIFPPQERCSRERDAFPCARGRDSFGNDSKNLCDAWLTPGKFIYRLTACPELSLGLFSTMTSAPEPEKVPTFSHARPAYSANPDHKQTLIGMIVATKTASPVVTDESMETPSKPRESGDIRGHQEGGRTICIHSFGILPVYQGRGLGRVLLKSYQQRMESSGIADRIALLSHDELVNMYTNMGFSKKGTSDSKFGGGGWTDLVYEFPADKGPPL